MAEWFKAAVLKTAVGASPPWVRIPPLPPCLNKIKDLGGNFGVIITPVLTALSAVMYSEKARHLSMAGDRGAAAMGFNRTVAANLL